MKILKKLILLLILSAAIVACDKEEKYQSSGTITGPDIRVCICCGGYFIDIEDSTFNFDTLPSTSQINLVTDTFPMNVKLDWTYDRKCGGIQYINISRIEKQ